MPRRPASSSWSHRALQGCTGCTTTPCGLDPVLGRIHPTPSLTLGLCRVKVDTNGAIDIYHPAQQAPAGFRHRECPARHGETGRAYPARPARVQRVQRGATPFLSGTYSTHSARMPRLARTDSHSVQECRFSGGTLGVWESAAGSKGIRHKKGARRCDTRGSPGRTAIGRPPPAQAQDRDRHGAQRSQSESKSMSSSARRRTPP